MSDRDRYRALMLEHLYGLLEPAEARELSAYLASPDGAELRAEAEQWRDRIAAAARVEFPAVIFSPPTRPTIPKPVATPARRQPLTMPAVWTRWGVAASVLVLLGFGAPAAYQFFGWYAQSREARDLKVAADSRRDELRKVEQQHQARLEEARKEQEQAIAAQRAAEQAFRDALGGAHKAIEDKDFLVRLTGPEHAPPGAPSEWKIETVTKDGRPALPRKVEVVVRDQRDNELLRETHTVGASGSPTLRLSPAFWDRVKPGSDLHLEVMALGDDNRRSVLAARLPLARPVYVTHLVTDKPLYQPGDTVRFRSLTLDRATFLPPDRDMNLVFRLHKPDGAVVPAGEGNGRVVRPDLTPVLGPDGKPLRGLGTGEHVLEDDAPPGEYELELAEVSDQNPDGTALATRKFRVARYVVEKFEKRVDFDGKSYGPGDMVQARIDVSRTEGGPMTDARADVIVATEHGRTLHTEKGVQFEAIPDGEAKQSKTVAARVRFVLPADLLASRKPTDPPVRVTLTANIKDKADAEQIVRPVPLVEKELKVEFFPEGGDLVEGVPGRVYFEVRTPSGKPADLKGVITDGTDTVAEVATLTDPEQAGVNRGQGAFRLTPRPGKKYFLKVRSPTGITEPTKDGFPLPAARPDGVVLTALDPVTEKGAPIRVRVQVAKGPKTLHVGAYARGRLVGQERVEVEAGAPVEVKLPGDAALGGVTRVTVFEGTKAQGQGRVNLIPRAERLVYRKPGEQLALTATPVKERYAPAGKVGLDLAAANEKGQPAPAVLLVAVVNQSVIAMADNKTDRLLPTHFLLAGEVKHPADLEHADFLLTDHPKAPIALDLLLGTQGWRRFAEQNVLPKDPGERQEVERLLVAQGSRSSASVDEYRLAEQRVAAEFTPKVEQAAAREVDARAALAELQTTGERQYQSELTGAKARVEAADRDYQNAAAALYDYETRAGHMRSWALPLFLLGLVGLGAGAVVIARSRRPAERRPYVTTAVGAFAAALLVVGAVVVTFGKPDTERAYVAVRLHNDLTQLGTAMPQGPLRKKPDSGAPVPVRGKQEAPPPEAGRADAGPGKGTIPVRADRAAQRMVGPHAGDPGADWSAKREAEWRKLLAAGAKNLKAPPKADIPAAPPLEAEPVALPSVVREYAHRRDSALTGQDKDFTETVFWHPVLVLPDSGRAKVEFQLSDDVARYRVLVAGHTTDGRIGAAVQTIEAVSPAPTPSAKK
jgi:alpha-2-macroglobulin-like protein